MKFVSPAKLLVHVACVTLLLFVPILYQPALIALPAGQPEQVGSTAWRRSPVLQGDTEVAPRHVQLRPKARPAPNNREPIWPDQWPWSAIGRVNIATQGTFCTGTLVGRQTVVTAAHCLIDRRGERVPPNVVHFVSGLSPGTKFLGHSVASAYLISPDYKQEVKEQIRAEMVKYDWAVVSLHDALDLKVIPIEPSPHANLPRSGGEEEIVLPGYGADRPFLLSVSRGCSVTTDVPERGTGSLIHTCDTLKGNSGSPILLLHHGNATLVGIATAVPAGLGSPDAPAHGGYGVSGTEFNTAVSETSQ
jgi:protease YdgD